MLCVGAWVYLRGTPPDQFKKKSEADNAIAEEEAEDLLQENLDKTEFALDVHVDGESDVDDLELGNSNKKPFAE